MFESGKIYIVVEPVSWRYRINGLTTYLSALYDVKLESGDWFIVMNRRGTAVRTLHCTERYVELYELVLTEGKFPQLVAEATRGVKHRLHEAHQDVRPLQCSDHHRCT